MFGIIRTARDESCGFLILISTVFLDTLESFKLTPSTKAMISKNLGRISTEEVTTSRVLYLHHRYIDCLRLEVENLGNHSTECSKTVNNVSSNPFTTGPAMRTYPIPKTKALKVNGLSLGSSVMSRQVRKEHNEVICDIADRVPLSQAPS
jgi:hypothetical protein